MRRAGILLAIAVALVLAVAGCGADPDEGATPSTADNVSASADGAESTSQSRELGLVGVWKRLTTCRERVAALEAAGLERFAAEHAVGEGWIPGVTRPEELEDPDRPCKHAVPLVHSHVFTADGLFGSRDAQGDPVDDGTYQLEGEDTVVIDKEFGAVTFHYEIAAGDTLTLEPVMPACAAEGCFAAQWAVGMSYPGLPWERAD